jgi:protein phosphatase
VAEESAGETVEFIPPPPPWGRAGFSSLVEVDLGALSHPGKVRPKNEDHYVVVRFGRSMDLLLTNLPEGEVPARHAEAGYGFAVADGIGGGAGGEVASRTAISVLLDLILRTPDWIMRLDESGIKEILRRTGERFREVSKTVAEWARADPSLTGMGTTMTVAGTLGADLFLAHVGDSRAYLFRKGQLHQLTRDDTVAQSLADLGAIAPEETATHPLRHVLTDAIGAAGSRGLAELQTMRLEDGDQLLLCTDGLTDMVPEAAVAEALRGPGSAADACRALVDLALEAGGKDNVTVVLGRYRIPV